MLFYREESKATAQDAHGCGPPHHLAASHNMGLSAVVSVFLSRRGQAAHANVATVPDGGIRQYAREGIRDLTRHA